IEPKPKVTKPKAEVAQEFKAENPEAIKAAQAVGAVAQEVKTPQDAAAAELAKIGNAPKAPLYSKQELFTMLDDKLDQYHSSTDPKVKAALSSSIKNIKDAINDDQTVMTKIKDAQRKA